MPGCKLDTRMSNERLPFVNVPENSKSLIWSSSLFHWCQWKKKECIEIILEWPGFRLKYPHNLLLLSWSFWGSHNFPLNFLSRNRIRPPWILLCWMKNLLNSFASKSMRIGIGEWFIGSMQIDCKFETITGTPFMYSSRVLGLKIAIRKIYIKTPFYLSFIYLLKYIVSEVKNWMTQNRQLSGFVFVS